MSEDAISIATSPIPPAGLAGQPAAGYGLSELLERLYRESGCDFRGYKKTSLTRRISKRLSAHGIASYEEYLRLLTSDPAEYRELLSTVTIKVSEFFREPEVFGLIERLLADGFYFTGPLRAWCCGCATGEEAYSLGIILAESSRHNAALKARIFATDIDDDALDFARKAMYGEDVMRNVGGGLRERYFIKTDRGYRVKYDVRDMVRFGGLDIVGESPIHRVDVLFCRNLFIYFEKRLQRSVFRKLHYALKPGGLLVLGRAENLPPAFQPLYAEVADGARVYRKVSAGPE
ncbi:MAG: protein-glutamate O-methyltransferase CheR [Deltaproteobacteria bacterium]|nr:protein-glutamate O-methyltransferase CheR [Deltaproteobacteria bacterium]